MSCFRQEAPRLETWEVTYDDKIDTSRRRHSARGGFTGVVDVSLKPADATDACFDLQGRKIHAGADAWSGILDGAAAGPCTQKFQLYGTSRMVAGAPIEGGIYACARKPVATAVADGTYGAWTPDAAQRAQLQQIFPQGVCDYARPDTARP